VQAAEISLVATELVTSALLDGDLGPADRLRVVTKPVAGTLEVHVHYPPAEGSVQPIRGLPAALLDRLARDWGRRLEDGDACLWAAVRRRARDMSATTDEDLLALAAIDPDARAEVFRRWSPMAHQICRRYRGAGIDDQDLGQVAAVALMNALRRYDARSGNFEHYAAATISGELKRLLRDRGWSVRVPRGLKEAALEVTRAGGRLSQRLGRTPGVDDISEETGLDRLDVLEAMSAGGAYRIASLDRTGVDGVDDTTMLDRMGSEDVNFRLAEEWHAVAPALRRLPERERRILYLRFFEDMTQSEIAAEVGLSQMHVSRLLSRSLDRLKAMTA
jgi:RNA polymerase sigma-B factor